MTVQRFLIKPNLYRDSVGLMQLAAGLRERLGVQEAGAVMATPANLEALEEAGLRVPADLKTNPGDLLLAAAGAEENLLEQALAWAEAALARAAPSDPAAPSHARAPQTIQQAAHAVDRPGVAVISVPGEYAYGEALKALRAGMHVFLFSSGVALGDERRLKEIAAGQGLLMMGAECGTAMINGVPYGFANEVRRGGIGLVAASGSGLQEVMCLIDAWGGGISHAIGTGGRDLNEQIGGLTMLAGLRLLADDPGTEVIVLLSKPPAPAVAQRIVEEAGASGKPVVFCFLDRDKGALPSGPWQGVSTLEKAASLAVEAVGGTVPPIPQPSAPRTHGYLRGLFSGGTLASEAKIILEPALGPMMTDLAPGPPPAAHLCVDLGDERYTRGRPHPMIDPGFRARLFEWVLKDPSTGILLFDVVLGHGAHGDPSGPLLEILSAVPGGGRPVIVAHVCGTDADPQNREKQIDDLERAGVIVAPTNAAAARLTVEILEDE